RMLTPRRLVQFIRPNDWFITIDSKVAYFHVPIHHRHRRYLRFAFGGIAYQFNALPFGLSLAPRVFTKCVEAAIAPLRLRGLRVCNYLDDWLIASHSKAAAVQDGHLVVAHLYRLGFVVNREKSVLCPRQVTHFQGMILDSTSMEVRLSQERINAIKTCVRQFRRGHSDLRKNRSLPQTSYAFSGYDLRLHLHGGQAVSRTDKCHHNMRAPVPTGTVSLVAALPTPVRDDGVGRYSA